MEPPLSGGSILVCAAHPDDIESWCAGTLACAIDRVANVRLVLVTSGEKGSSDPFPSSLEIAAIREREAAEAAACLGLKDVIFLRQEDGEVEPNRALRGDIIRLIRRWQPDVVFTHDPEHPLPAYIAHRDYRAVGRAVLDAVYPQARDHLSFREHRDEGLTPHRVGAVWLFASAVADRYVDITSGWERKINARLAHASQTPDPSALRASWRRRFEAIGATADLPLAEAFTVLHLD